MRASGWGTDGGYVARAVSGDGPLLIVQVETVAAVKGGELADIAATDGVDGMFVGPLDLAFSAGCNVDVDAPEVVAMRREIEAAAKKEGIILAGFAAGSHTPAAMLADGYDIVAAAADVALLRGAALECVRAARA